MQILVKNGTLVNQGRIRKADILISDSVVRRIADSISEDADIVINAVGMYIFPGFIDLHAHFRDPGLTYKEDIESGEKAAAAGGFTTVCVMPNTKPVTDTNEKIRYVLNKAGLINVLPFGSVTKNQAGLELADLAGMTDAAGFSEDGKTVVNAGVMRAALFECVRLGKTMFSHCEDVTLIDYDDIYGGNPNMSEDVIIARDIVMARELSAKLHICHVSTRSGVDIIRSAKSLGVSVTAEATPHHLTLCRDDIVKGDSNYKMNPPLRSREDRDALVEALKDGTIDAIATDHAPHSESEKGSDYKNALNGIIGLETAFPLSLGLGLPLETLARRMSETPAKILGIDKGRIAEGKVADLTIADINEEYNIPDKFYSKARNTPFIGKKVRGRIKYTICNGKIAFRIP
ncbi:dihydroorotase [Clostridia bacterium]|nr:dihydroorotase [Clostridia bacterium]